MEFPPYEPILNILGTELHRRLTEGLGYHYHADAAGTNAILGCHVAEAGCASEDRSAARDATKRPPRP